MSSFNESGWRSLVQSPEELFWKRLDARLDSVEEAIQDVFAYAERRARRLSNAHGRDAEYFLGLMFDRGAFLHPMSRPSALGSWGSPSDNEVDDADNFARRQREFADEFDTLTKENQLILSNFLKENDYESRLARRSAPSDRPADVELVLDNIKGMILLLKCRCGVDGFFCLTRNNKAYELHPQWFFSDPEIDNHLLFAVEGWEASSTASALEAFGLSVSPRRYATWMREVIENRLNELLILITRKKTVRMDYENYEKAILIDLGVELVGWTHDTFARPSTLPLDIRPLEALLRAVSNGECCFRHITEDERAHHLQNYKERTRAGDSA